MLILILLIVIALVAWSLHLMQQAVDCDEFSLMLAGTLVAFSAAAMVVVYFLTGNYIGYMTTMAPPASDGAFTDAAWVMERNERDATKLFLSDSLIVDTVPTIAPSAL